MEKEGSGGKNNKDKDSNKSCGNVIYPGEFHKDFTERGDFSGREYYDGNKKDLVIIKYTEIKSNLEKALSKLEEEKTRLESIGCGSPVVGHMRNTAEDIKSIIADSEDAYDKSYEDKSDDVVKDLLMFIYVAEDYIEHIEGLVKECKKFQ